MSFLGTQAVFLADLTLIVQIAAFVILLSGVIYVKKKNLQNHFKMADIAVFFGLLAFLWMGFSLVKNFKTLILNITASSSLFTIIHVAIGLIALITGVLFVSNRYIKKIRFNMRIAFLLWAMALFFGIVLYTMYYL